MAARRGGDTATGKMLVLHQMVLHPCHPHHTGSTECVCWIREREGERDIEINKDRDRQRDREVERI